MRLVAIILIVLGTLGLVYQGFTYVSRDRIAEVGPVKVEADRTHYVWVPPVVSGVGLVSGLIENQPETAWTWALSIQSEDIRFNAIRLAYMGMQRRNPDAAAQLLQEAKLSAQQMRFIQGLPPQ